MASVGKHVGGMGSMKLTALALLAIITGGAIIFLVTWSQRPDYGVLFAGLAPEDAGAIIAKLGDKNIPYKIDGGIISVPVSKVHETRMLLAEDGLPGGGGVGFELFDKNNFGLTDFVQKINFRRAMQGELSRSITEIVSVSSARVHLVIPEKGVFLDEKKKARASIVLKLRPGASLSGDEVRAIVHLVAGSIADLEPADVTIVDTSGKLWTSKGNDDSAEGLMTSQMDYKKRLEASLARRVQSMIEKALGNGKVVARISVDLERRRVDRTEEIYDPDSQVIRSEHRTKESSGSGAGAGGVPGVVSNLPGGAGKAASNGARASQKDDEVINYEINKVVKRIVEPFGQIKKLSVAVLVDGVYTTAESGADGGRGKRTYTPRTAEELAKISSIVKATVGFDEKRGDTVSVVNIPFEETLPVDNLAPIEPSVSMTDKIMPLAAKYGSVGLSVLFLIFFVIRPIIKRLTIERVALESINNNLPDALNRGDDELALPSGSKKNNADTTEQLKQLVRENPRQAAMVLKGWMQER